MALTLRNKIDFILRYNFLKKKLKKLDQKIRKRKFAEPEKGKEKKETKDSTKDTVVSLYFVPVSVLSLVFSFLTWEQHFYILQFVCKFWSKKLVGNFTNLTEAGCWIHLSSISHRFMFPLIRRIAKLSSGASGREPLPKLFWPNLRSLSCSGSKSSSAFPIDQKFVEVVQQWRMPRLEKVRLQSMTPQDIAELLQKNNVTENIKVLSCAVETKGAVEFLVKNFPNVESLILFVSLENQKEMNVLINLKRMKYLSIDNFGKGNGQINLYLPQVEILSLHTLFFFFPGYDLKNNRLWFPNLRELRWEEEKRDFPFGAFSELLPLQPKLEKVVVSSISHILPNFATAANEQLIAKLKQLQKPGCAFFTFGIAGHYYRGYLEREEYEYDIKGEEDKEKEEKQKGSFIVDLLKGFVSCLVKANEKNETNEKEEEVQLQLQLQLRLEVNLLFERSEFTFTVKEKKFFETSSVSLEELYEKVLSLGHPKPLYSPHSSFAYGVPGQNVFVSVSGFQKPRK